MVPSFHGALRPQKPYGLLGTGEDWVRGWKPRPISLFTQLLSFAHTVRVLRPFIFLGLPSRTLYQSLVMTSRLTLFYPFGPYGKQKQQQQHEKERNVEDVLFAGEFRPNDGLGGKAKRQGRTGADTRAGLAVWLRRTYISTSSGWSRPS